MATAFKLVEPMLGSLNGRAHTIFRWSRKSKQFDEYSLGYEKFYPEEIPPPWGAVHRLAEFFSDKALQNLETLEEAEGEIYCPTELDKLERAIDNRNFEKLIQKFLES